MKLRIINGALVAILSLTMLVASASPTQAIGAQSWDCGAGTSHSARVAWKTNGFVGSLGGASSGALPEPALATVGVDLRNRRWIVWLYPGNQTEYFPFDAATVELTAPGGFPTGRIDPVGLPVVVYHDGRLKALYGQWGGDGNPDVALYRVDFDCTYHP